MSRHLTAAALAAFTGMFLLAAPSPASAQEGVSGAAVVTDRPVVAASGQGEVTLRPDMATVSVTIRTVAPEPDQASRRNEELASAVTEAIEALDLEPDSLRLTGVRLGPNREHTPDGPRDRGYFAQRSLQVTTNDLIDVGRIIDAAVGAGATSVDHVAYSASDESAARREALVEAVEKARADAQVVATAAGGSLGPVIQLSTQDVAVPRPMYRMEMAAADAAGQPSLPEPEDLTITAFVQAEWEFVEEE